MSVYGETGRRMHKWWQSVKHPEKKRQVLAVLLWVAAASCCVGSWLVQDSTVSILLTLLNVGLLIIAIPLPMSLRHADRIWMKSLQQSSQNTSSPSENQPPKQS